MLISVSASANFTYLNALYLGDESRCFGTMPLKYSVLKSSVSSQDILSTGEFIRGGLFSSVTLSRMNECISCYVPS